MFFIFFFFWGEYFVFVFFFWGFPFDQPHLWFVLEIYDCDIDR